LAVIVWVKFFSRLSNTEGGGGGGGLMLLPLGGAGGGRLFDWLTMFLSIVLRGGSLRRSKSERERERERGGMYGLVRRVNDTRI
jgi:uncharacterized membrane protein